MRARLSAAAAALAAVAVLIVAPTALAASPPPLAVTGASLTVASTGQRLYGYNADKQLLVASDTKLMTALVALQHVHNWNQLFTAHWEASSVDSQIGLEDGERMSAYELLEALLLPSADDAAMDLAYNVGGGSVDRFVAEMNSDAAALGLTHTHFSNPVGMDSDDNYSSPYDLTRLAAYDMAHYPMFDRIVAMPSATLSTGDYVRHITNTDTLLGAEPWITGVKTGHTTAAGYILVSSGTQHGLTLVDSVLGTDSEATRNADALALLQYGFAEFHQVAPIRTGMFVKRLAVHEESTRAAVVTHGHWQRVLPKSDRIRITYKLPRQLTGPLAAGRRVGTATVLVNGHDAGAVPLVLRARVPSVPALTALAHFIGGPTTLGVLALALGVALTALELRRRRPQAVAGERAELEAR